MSKKKIYISSPITGYNLNERHKFFAQIEKELTILGCDGIVVPNRWRCSKGCETERRVADACGIPVVGMIGETHDLQITNAI